MIELHARHFSPLIHQNTRWYYESLASHNPPKNLGIGTNGFPLWIGIGTLKGTPRKATRSAYLNFLLNLGIIGC